MREGRGVLRWVEVERTCQSVEPSEGKLMGVALLSLPWGRLSCPCLTPQGTLWIWLPPSV